MCYETFLEHWDELTNAEKIALFNEYASEHDADNYIYDFSEELFNEFFAKPADAARAVVFGSVDWSHDYIRFNGYGNLQSMTERDAAEFAEMYADEIYDADAYGDYIDDDDDDDDE